MPRAKRVTITVPLIPGRDDRLIEFFSQPHVHKAKAMRQGAELLLDQLEGKEQLESEIRRELAELRRLIQEAGLKPPEKPKSKNPFLSASP